MKSTHRLLALAATAGHVDAAPHKKKS